MHIINARLRNQEGLHELHLEDGLIRSIARQTEAPTLGPDDLDADLSAKLQLPAGDRTRWPA